MDYGFCDDSDTHSNKCADVLMALT